MYRNISSAVWPARLRGGVGQAVADRQASQAEGGRPQALREPRRYRARVRQRGPPGGQAGGSPARCLLRLQDEVACRPTGSGFGIKAFMDSGQTCTLVSRVFPEQHAGFLTH